MARKRKEKTVSGNAVLDQERTTAPLSIPGSKISPEEDKEKKARGILTVRSAVSEERDQKRHVVDVLQVRPNLMDTTR